MRSWMPARSHSLTVRQHLFETYEEEYTFDELRIARLFLSGEDKMAIEEIG
jgi:hypothetical protein